MYGSRKHRIGRLIAILPVFLAVFAGMVWVVSALWNWLMPSIFGLHAITYWQALGLMALCWILFRGFRGPRFAHGGPWRHDLGERFGRMAPADREEFMNSVRGRWHAMRERWARMTSAEREEFMKGFPSLWQDMLERWGKMTPAEREEFVKGRRSPTESPEPEPKA
jgi:hypothetical protein